MARGRAALARDFTVVCADLRGYGRSGCPASTADHAPYAKRAMARDMVRGDGATRLSRASRSPATTAAGASPTAWHSTIPSASQRLAVLDIVPTETSGQRADARLALAYWPWSLLAQPEPLPERLLAAAPEAVVDNALGSWGSPAGVFGEEVRAAYVDALRDAAHVHAICEEYRAAATIDRAHDQADRRSRPPHRLPACWRCGARAARSTPGMPSEGGPLALWRAWADDVQGHAIDAGHFFPEEAPGPTAEALRRFFFLLP